MSSGKAPRLEGLVVEEQVHLSLWELSRACSADEECILVWVYEGVLEPLGESLQDWRFGGESLRRARLAQRLTQDLGLNPAGVALALDLLDEIAILRVRLQRARVS